MALSIVAHSPLVLAADKIVMAAVVSKDTNQLGKLANLIYVEAFRRLGMTMEYVQYPAARASAEADIGEVDGELGRVQDYGETHPNLVRVNESPLFFTVAAFAIDPAIKVNGWESLREKPYRVDYRLGYKLFQDQLPKLVEKKNLTAIRDTENGLMKLIAHHSDIYLDGLDVVTPLLATAPFSSSGIHSAGELDKIHLYAYLNKKYQSLEPRLADILREMKKEGLIERYRVEAYGQ